MQRKALWLLISLVLSGVFKIYAGEHQPLNISFTENKGQWSKEIRYKADLPFGTLFLENNALTYHFVDEVAVKKLLWYKYDTNHKVASAPPAGLVKAHAYRVELLNALPDPILHARQAFTDYKNFYLGNDPSRWASSVRHYNTVSYNNVYPGTCLEVAQENGRLKYSFYLEAGANPGKIKLGYTGNMALKLHKGKLRIITSVNSIEEQIPVAWQTTAAGEKKPVRCDYHLEDNVLSFRFPEGTDTSLPLVIDPELIFSSYSGSTADNWGFTATYDKEGFLYAGGIGFGLGYPTTLGAYQLSYAAGSCDITISKFDTTGSILIFSTYLGGSGSEVPASLVVDNSNNLYVMSCTGSSDFPVTQGAFDESFNGGNSYILDFVIQYLNGSDLAIARFNADGSALLSSTYYGGTGNEGLNFTFPLKKNYADDVRGEIKANDNGDIFVVSTTSSFDLPLLPNAAQDAFGGIQDAFVIKMSGNLSNLSWATYLGGSDADAGYSLVLSSGGNVYVGGGTKSIDFPVTPGSFQPVNNGGSSEGYITCIASQGDIFPYSTYYGANAYDQVYFVDIDKEGFIYAMGQTDAGGYSFIDNAPWHMPGGGQFVSKFYPDLGSREWSTAFGTGNGGPDISPTAFMADYCKNIYISGWGSPSLNGFGGTSGLPVSADAYQGTTDDNDYYFIVFDGTASNLVYGSFFGGNSAEHVDGGTSRFDKKGRIYQAVCAGCGGSNSFPTTPGAWSTVNGSGNCNIGVIKFDFNIPLVVADFIQPPSACTQDTVFFQNTSIYQQNSNATVLWNFGDGNISALANPSHVYSQSGIFIVSLIISDTASCNVHDTAYMTVFVLSDTTSALNPKETCLGESTPIGVHPIPDPSLTYQWIPPLFLSNTSISDPLASPPFSMDYKLLISNGLCTDTLTQQVKVWNLTADAGPDTTVCISSIQLTAGGTGDNNLQYQWSGNSGFTDTLNTQLSDSTVIVQLLNQSNWFYVKVFNEHCFAIDSVNVSFSILLSPGVGQNPSCPDICDGSGWVSVSSGPQDVTFLWSTGSTNDSIFNLCDGTYTVTVSDEASCISVAAITLTDPPALNAVTAITPLPCIEVCHGEISLSLSGGSPPYSYAWSNGDTSLLITDLCAGQYFVTITDDRGCKTLSSAQVIVDPVFSGISVDATRDTLYQGQSTQLIATPLSGCTYEWTPITGLTNPSASTTVAAPTVTTVYHVLITDPSGCTYSDSVKIFVKDVFCREPYIYVPNAFTPNSDNNNDKVFVRGEYIESLKFSIFNRWGELVFETSDLHVGWNGFFRSEACEPGVYVYYLEATCYNKEVFKGKGNITLIR